MISQVYWIETPAAGRLAIVPRPRTGDWLGDEIAGWRAAGIDLVVSLLEPEEVAELGLQGEAGLCRENMIAFVSFPIPDRGVPRSWLAASGFVRMLALRASQGEAVAIHCRAGIGRSAVIAACALIRLGASPDQAFEAIAKSRGVEVPDTQQQREWVGAFADWLQSGGTA